MTRRLLYILLGAALLLGACPTDGASAPSFNNNETADDTGDDTGGQDEPPPDEEWGASPVPSAGPDSPAGPAAAPMPSLLAAAIGYDGDGHVSVVFTFNMNVDITLSDGWQADKTSGTNSLTVTPLDGDPGPRLLSFTAANSEATDKKINFTGREVIVTSGVFERTANAATYTAELYDNGAAGIIPETETEGDAATKWLYIKEDDPRLRAMLRAACQSPDTAPLFHITVGQNADSDSIEVRGTGLPQPAKSRAIINIGLPDDPSANILLPEFSVPFGELGENDKDYSHIMLRVNRNTRLFIEAGDGNGGYGLLAGAGIEVTGGGRLRSGTAGGFPLGKDSYVISRLNSSLEAEGKVVIGPASEAPVIEWGTGDQNGSFVEIREIDGAGRIAFDVNLIVKKTLRLEYSVWFIGGPSLTINVQTPDNGQRGVFSAAVDGLRFYGTSSFAGGHNLVRPAAAIIVKPGSSLSKCFIADGGTDPLTAVSGDITVRNAGNNGNPFPFTSAYGASYYNWKW